MLVTEFQGGIEDATLEFVQSKVNDTLALEIPRGATIETAELSIGGVLHKGDLNEVFDFNSTGVGADIWARHTGKFDKYPPDFDPTTVVWPKATKGEVNALKQVDNDYWLTHTPNITQFPPPLEWPVQFYHFNPSVNDPLKYTVHWRGYSTCSQNKTTLYHCEMWLWNNSEDVWDQVANYSGNKLQDRIVEHSFAPDSDYVATNGSIFVAMVGQHMDGQMGRPPVYDIGILRTEYIGVNVTKGSVIEYPRDVSVHVGGVTVLSLEGPLTGTVNIGDGSGLTSAIQGVIDSEEVRPGNLTIPIIINVGYRTGARVHVEGLRITYEPVVNEAPEWTGDTTTTVEEDSDWSSVIDLAGFTDDYTTGDLVYAVESVSDTANLSARVSIGASPERYVEVKPAPDFFGEVEVVLSATDLFGAKGFTPPITVVVEQVGDKPFIEPVEVQTLDEGDTLDLTIEVEDPDLPDDTLTFSDTSDELDIDPSTGRILWTPGPTHVGTHKIGVYVEDRFGFNSSILLTVVVENVNFAPSITSSLVMDATQDEEATYVITAEDEDVPFGDVLTYFAICDQVVVQCDPSTGKVTFTPGNENVPSVSIEIAVEDAAGQRVQAVVMVSVGNVNDPPTIGQFTPAPVNQGGSGGHTLTFDDPDLHIDIDPAEAITITYVGHEAFAPDEEGRIYFEAHQSLVGTHTVEYTVTDTGGLSDTISVVWEVVNANDAPVILTNVPSPLVATEDQEFSMTFEAEDLDGDTLHWIDDSDLFEIDSATGEVSFLPTQADVGSRRVTVTVSDGEGGIASVTFDLVVENVNDDPVIEYVSPADGSKYKEGQTIEFGAFANDEDGDALTYTWKRGEKVLGSGDRLSYSKLSPGKHTVTLVVSDGTSEVNRDLTVTVREEGSMGGTMTLLFIIALVAIAAAAMMGIMMVRRRAGGQLRKADDPQEEG